MFPPSFTENWHFILVCLESILNNNGVQIVIVINYVMQFQAFFYITLLLMERNVTGICVVILYLMELDNLFITSNTLWTFRNVPYMQSFYLQIDTEL